MTFEFPVLQIFQNKCMHLLSRWKNNIPAASQLSVYTCRILSFIEHVYCFFRSSKFQLGCRLPRLGLFLTGLAHDDNGAQRSSRYLLASGPPTLVIFCLTTSAGSFFYWIKHTAQFYFPLEMPCPTSVFQSLPIVLLVHIHVSLYWKHINFPFHIYILIFVVFSHPALIFSPLVFP